jgi:hypothetical protein
MHSLLIGELDDPRASDLFRGFTVYATDSEAAKWECTPTRFRTIEQLLLLSE